MIVRMQELTRGKADLLSLAQGIVHWAPPPPALDAARAAVDDPATHGYGDDAGLAELRAALATKLARDNGLGDVDVMVTASVHR